MFSYLLHSLDKHFPLLWLIIIWWICFCSPIPATTRTRFAVSICTTNWLTSRSSSPTSTSSSWRQTARVQNEESGLSDFSVRNLVRRGGFHDPVLTWRGPLQMSGSQRLVGEIQNHEIFPLSMEASLLLMFQHYFAICKRKNVSPATSEKRGDKVLKLKNICKFLSDFFSVCLKKKPSWFSLSHVSVSNWKHEWNVHDVHTPENKLKGHACPSVFLGLYVIVSVVTHQARRVLSLLKEPWVTG